MYVRSGLSLAVHAGKTVYQAVVGVQDSAKGGAVETGCSGLH